MQKIHQHFAFRISNFTFFISPLLYPFVCHIRYAQGYLQKTPFGKRPVYMGIYRKESGHNTPSHSRGESPLYQRQFRGLWQNQFFPLEIPQGYWLQYSKAAFCKVRGGIYFYANHISLLIRAVRHHNLFFF